MDFKQDSPTFNESSKLEANLVNPDEALRTGLPLQRTSNMVRIVRWQFSQNRASGPGQSSSCDV